MSETPVSCEMPGHLRPQLALDSFVKGDRRRGRAGACLAAMLTLGTVGGVDAREDVPSKSAAVAQALTQRLEQVKLQYVAARDPGEEGRFVAAMHFPGVQLLVISAKYSAPPLITEKLIQGKYQDIYVDLSSASDRASRIVIDDLRANGLARVKPKNQPPDVYEGGGKRVVFDFEWRKQKLTQDEYFKALESADDQYTRILTLLLEQAKK
jgi:hypothetical protein